MMTSYSLSSKILNEFHLDYRVASRIWEFDDGYGNLMTDLDYRVASHRVASRIWEFDYRVASHRVASRTWEFDDSSLS